MLTMENQGHHSKLRIQHDNHFINGLGNGEHVNETLHSVEEVDHLIQFRKIGEELHSTLQSEHQKYSSDLDSIVTDGYQNTGNEQFAKSSLSFWTPQGALSITTVVGVTVIFYLIYSNKAFKKMKVKINWRSISQTRRRSVRGIAQAAKKKCDDYVIIREEGNESILPSVVDENDMIASIPFNDSHDNEYYSSLRHRKVVGNTTAKLSNIDIEVDTIALNHPMNDALETFGTGLEGFGNISSATNSISSTYSLSTKTDELNESCDLEMPVSSSAHNTNIFKERVIPNRITRDSFHKPQANDSDVESPMVPRDVISFELTPTQRNVTIINPCPSQHAQIQQLKVSPSQLPQHIIPLIQPPVPPLPNFSILRESKSFSPLRRRPSPPHTIETSFSAAEPINHEFGESTEGANGILHKRRDLTFCSDAASSLTTSIPFSEIHLKNLIGGGGFGQVWSATWRGTPVAVKVLSASNQTTNVPAAILQEFAAEINMLSGMRHPNICLYIGASLDPPNRAIVTELAANGSLWDALRLPLKAPYSFLDNISSGHWPVELNEDEPRHSGQVGSINVPIGTWPWALVRRVAEGSARGMNYLHCGKPAVLHRDLKSANVLLDEAYIPKVCDFGLSRLNTEENSMTGNCGTVQWMAPEILANEKYAEPADVYSYGVILWELLTRECPYEGMNSIQCAMAVLNRGAKPEIPSWCPKRFSSLVAQCLQKDPKDRPSFSDILDIISKLPM